MLQEIKDHLRKYGIYYLVLYIFVAGIFYILTKANMTLREQLERKPTNQEFKTYILTGKIINTIPQEEEK